MIDIKAAYKDADVLITGGTGFLGRNLATALARLGASVTISDLPEKYVDGDFTAGDIHYEQADITDAERMNRLVPGRDYLFELAGLSGVADSNEQPLRHLTVNCGGHLNVLEACRAANPEVKLFFPSSQLIYGRAVTMPVSETQPANPKCVYGIQKLSMEHMFRLYYELYGMKTSCLRISNPYGPGQKDGQSYGVVNNFTMRALRGEAITIYGDGSQIRDFVYIDDVVAAILAAAASPGAYGRVFNCGGPEEISLLALAELIVETAGSGLVRKVPWPEEAKKADIGDMFLGKSAINKELEWVPATGLSEGIRQTVEYYAKR